MRSADACPKPLSPPATYRPPATSSTRQAKHHQSRARALPTHHEGYSWSIWRKGGNGGCFGLVMWRVWSAVMTAVCFGIRGGGGSTFLSWWMRYGEKSVAAVLVGGFVAGRMEAGVEPDRVGEVQVGNVGTQQPLFEGSGLVRTPAPGTNRHESKKAPRKVSGWVSRNDQGDEQFLGGDASVMSDLVRVNVLGENDSPGWC